MSFGDEIIQENPNKYETILESRILGKQLQMKINQYNALQNQYDILIKKEGENRKSSSSGWKRMNGRLKQTDKWLDIQNENYQTGMVSSPDESNENWNFLGKVDSLDECKIKAVEDKDKQYSSTVYYPSDFGNDWNNSCFGGIKGKSINSVHQLKTVTSLPPNGTTRLGGEEGEKLLKEMKNLQKEIKKLVKKTSSNGVGLQKTNELLKNEMITKNADLSKLMSKLDKDRIEIDKLMSEPDETGGEEDSNIRQMSSYTTYGLWILLVLISLYIAFHIYSQEFYSISYFAYLFIGIWTFILIKQFYLQYYVYGVKTWNFLSNIVPPVY